MRDIDRIVAEVRRRFPSVTVEQLKVRYPGADDDGIWFFRSADRDFEGQLESSYGSFPFLAESDHGDRQDVHTIDEALAVLDRWFRSRQSQ